MLPKSSTRWRRCTNITNDRQTTDGFAMIVRLKVATSFTSVSARRISTNAHVQLKACTALHPIFKGNISIAEYMPPSNLLQNIKINGGVEQVCMKNARFSTNIWSITDECSRLITIWTTVLAYRTWANDGVDGRNKRCPLMNGTATREWLLYMTQVTEDTSKTNCPKITMAPYLDWRPLKISPPKVEKPKYRRALPSCTFSRQSVRDICPRTNIHIFLIGEYWSDLKIWVRGRSRSLKMSDCRSIDHIRLYIGLPL